MALNMSTPDDIQAAQNLAQEFKAGHWQRPDLCIIPENDPRLKLTGVSLGIETISRRHQWQNSFGRGNHPHPAQQRHADFDLFAKIDKAAAEIVIAGEEQPRWRHLSR